MVKVRNLDREAQQSWVRACPRRRLPAYTWARTCAPGFLTCELSERSCLWASERAGVLGTKPLAHGGHST